MTELKNLTKKWSVNDIEECLLLQNIRSNQNSKFENELLICIYLNNLAVSLKEKNELHEGHTSFNFLYTNKKYIMDLLNVKRHKVDLGLRYLEGASMIKITRMNQMTFELTNVGNKYITHFLKTDNGKKLLEGISIKENKNAN